MYLLTRFSGTVLTVPLIGLQAVGEARTYVGLTRQREEQLSGRIRSSSLPIAVNDWTHLYLWLIMMSNDDPQLML